MEKIRCYWSPKTEIKTSKIGGKGLFAKANIQKGEIVFIKAGHIVEYDEMMKYRTKVGDFDVQISDNFFWIFNAGCYQLQVEIQILLQPYTRRK